MLYYPFHRMSSRFTAEGENARRKNGRIKDKSVRNVPGPIKEEREIRGKHSINSPFHSKNVILLL